MGLLLTALFLVALACSAFAVLSYAFAWYEAAAEAPELCRQRFAPASLRLASRLLILESAALTVTVLLHPLGWLPRLGLPQPRPTGRAVILLHGLFQSRACWYWTGLRLWCGGVRRLSALPLPPWESLPALSERVAREVERQYAATGQPVALVGHSMGGIVARSYLARDDAAGKVDRCVLLATPHGGSKLAPFALSPLGQLVLPGSDVLRQLAATPLASEVRCVNLLSRHDNIVLPWQHAYLPGAENLELRRIGHTSLLFHPQVIAVLRDALQGD